MEDFFDLVQDVRRRRPLVQCITNFVTVNDCANILLAAGGRPTMAHDIREVEEAAAAADALVCNLGAIEQVESMERAGRQANRLARPVVLDPVGAGGTTLRRTLSARLLDKVRFAVIRGNASEIRALATGGSAGSGVDAEDLDAVAGENLGRMVDLAGGLARRTGAVIAVSGETDLVCDGKRAALLRNGCATMARITGSGCMVTTLMGAFCAVCPQDPFQAAAAALGVMGVCGELAEERRLRLGTGNATFRNDLIDAVFNLTEQQLQEKIRYELYKG